MATSGRKLDDHTRQQIQRMRDAGVSVRETAKRADVSPATVSKFPKNALAK